MKYIALIDGGEVCFRVSAGAQIRRWLIYEEGEKDWIKAYQYKKDAVEWINRYDTRSEEDKKEDPWFNCVLDSKPTSEKFALINTKKFIDNIASKLRTDDILICFGSVTGENFRDELATFKKYKDRPKDKPHHYNAVKNYIKITYPFLEVDDPLEDDDVLASMSITFQKLAEIDPHAVIPVICSHDKDMKQVPGMHLHTDTMELFEVSAVEGLRNFYKQLISGDPTDTIPGIYQITGKKNSKEYAKHIDTLEDEYDMYNFVANLYATSLGTYRESDLDCILWEIGNLLYLKRNWYETWEIPN